jgi:3-oxoacyl-(acyl-carrier-protein) synthase
MESTITNELFQGSPLISWKGSLGHTLGSCALVELAIAIEAMAKGTVPGTIGSCAPYFAENVASENFTSDSFDGCILLSNAFGGAHAAMHLSHV